MIYYIIVGLLCAIFGAAAATAITWYVCWKTPKDKIQTINEVVVAQNHQIAADNESLKEQKELINKQIIEETNNLYKIYQQIDEATFKVDTVKEEAETAKQEFLRTNLEVAQNELDKSLEQMGAKYQQAENDYLIEYLSLMAEMTHDVDEDLNNKRQEASDLSTRIANMRSMITALVASQKRAQAEKTEKDFYRLILPKEDLIEIATLREISHKLRDPAPLNKVIWKVYYEKPYTDLVGRVLGQQTHTGIYKITNIENGMSYVGQAVNVAERWRQHIKRGLGAEAPTRNKLYPAMAEYGVENFTFELLTDCEAKDLNDLEDKYQIIFHCKDYGYSIK